MAAPTVKQVAARVWEIRPGWQDLLVFGVLVGAVSWLTGAPPLLALVVAAVGISVLSVLIAVKTLRDESRDDPPEGEDDADL